MQLLEATKAESDAALAKLARLEEALSFSQSHAETARAEAEALQDGTASLQVRRMSCGGSCMHRGAGALARRCKQ